MHRLHDPVIVHVKVKKVMNDIHPQIRRCAQVNSAVFDIVYDDMCNNPDVKSIHAVVLASCLDSQGELQLSPWVPAPLVNFVQREEQLWYATLSLTPSAMKYFIHADNMITFECRIQGHVTQIEFCTNQLMSLNGLNGQKLVDSQAFQYVIEDTGHWDEEEPEEEPAAPVKKRPTLSVVRND